MNPIRMFGNFVFTATGTVNNIINEAVSSSSEKADEINAKVGILGGSAISVITRIGMFVAVIAMIACGIGLIVSNANQREEMKTRLIWGLIGSAIIFAATAIINLVQATVGGMGF